MTDAQSSNPEAQPKPARMRKPRKKRTASESLLSIVLLLEAIVVFFITLTTYGLRILPAGVTFGGGAALFVLLLLVGRVVKTRAGVNAGWVLQVVLVVLGVLIPVMYFVGAIFLALWIYCFVNGRKLDRRDAQLEKDYNRISNQNNLSQNDSKEQ
jgi:uncharacterized membrane-anchored protein